MKALTELMREKAQTRFLPVVAYCDRQKIQEPCFIVSCQPNINAIFFELYGIMRCENKQYHSFIVSESNAPKELAVFLKKSDIDIREGILDYFKMNPLRININIPDGLSKLNGTRFPYQVSFMDDEISLFRPCIEKSVNSCMGIGEWKYFFTKQDTIYILDASRV